MTDANVTLAPAPFEGASEIRNENARLLQALDRLLGEDSRPESETAALLELDPQVRMFLDRGAATGVFIENIKERTACQVLLDYWSSTLSHAGVAVTRPRLAPFDAARLPDLKDRPCPFVGLEAFRDRTYFFGRDQAVDSLIERVAQIPLVVVQGASGSGKSSLVIGGALPALRVPEHLPPYRIVGPFTPGNAPLDGLASALAAAVADSAIDVAAAVAALRADPSQLVRMVDGRESTAVLLVVDQFEEVFTLSGESDRTALVSGIDALLQAHPEHRTILTLREEFSNELDKLEPLRPYLARHARFSMKEWSMGYDELKAAVERPAALVNLQFAPGIVDEMVKSVLGRDTALPLLQFALRSLWDLRDRNRITREVYEKIGSSPLAALERFADGFYNGLLRERKDEVERILLELVRIDRMLEPYRQPRLRSELLADGNPRTPEVLELLEHEDFVRITPTAGGRDAAVEVKHESLLRNWPRYIDWINRKRERVRQRIALTEAAQRWFDAGRSTSEGLLGAWQLKEVEHLPDLSAIEAEYVQASAQAADRERIAREETLRREERRRWIFGLAFVLLGVLVAGAWFVDRQRERRAVLRQTVDVQVEMARARDASTRGHLDDALTGSLQAVAGVHGLEGKEDQGILRAQAREMLLLTLRHAADLRRLYVAAGASFQTVAFHPTRPDALLAFAGADGRTYVAGLDSPVAHTLDSCGTSLATAVAFDPAGRVLVTGCSDGTLSVWSTDDWHKLGDKNKPVFDRRISTLAVSPDGRLIAAGGRTNQVALVAMAEDGAPTQQPTVMASGVLPTGFVWSLAFAPSGDELLVGDGMGTVLACKSTASAPWVCAKTPAYPGGTDDAILALAYAPDGAQLAVGRWQGGVEIWDAAFSPNSRVSIDVGQSLGPVYSLAFFDACGWRQLAIGKGVELLYRPVIPAPHSPAPPPGCALLPQASVGDEVSGIAAHAASGRLAAATRGGYVAVLDPKSGPDPLRHVVTTEFTKPDGPLRGAIVAQDGATALLAVPIAAAEPDGMNLALRRLRDSDIDHASQLVKQKVGGGNIQRVSASRKTRQLATLGCLVAAGTEACTAKDAREIIVSRLTDDLASLVQLISLGARDFGGLVPSRIALSPDGKWLAISFDHSGRLLAVPVDDAGGRRSWIDAGIGEVREIAFSHDGKFFGAGGAALEPPSGAGVDEVRLWNVSASGFAPLRQAALPLSSTANRVYELAFAADARGHPLVFAGGQSGAIDQWDVASGRMLGTLRADSRPIYHMTFSPDAALVAAVDSQNVVRLWDTSSWIPLQLTPPSDRTERPGFLAFGGSGTWLASGAGTLQLWDIEVGSLQRKLCALLREPGQHGADSPTPLWKGDGRCAAP